MNRFTVGPSQVVEIELATQYSEWTGEWCGLRWRPTKAQEPSWWGRLASRCMLGVRWYRNAKP